MIPSCDETLLLRRGDAIWRGLAQRELFPVASGWGDDNAGAVLQSEVVPLRSGLGYRRAVPPGRRSAEEDAS